MGNPGFDLHTHSSVSDGTDTPAQLVRNAAELGLPGIALTDHDTTAGLADAARAASNTGITLIRGIEVSALSEGRSLHILALGVTRDADTKLAQRLAEIRSSRRTRAKVMVERLSADFPITWEQILENMGASDAEASVGRPHIADALAHAGVVRDRSEAFAGILAPTSPYYVPYDAFTSADAIAAIHEAGAVAIGAHLLSAYRGVRSGADAIRALIAQGLDGLEIRHREHSEPARDILMNIAKENSLITTGGSDYHGHGKPNALGENTTPLVALERIADLVDQRGGDLT